MAAGGSIKYDGDDARKALLKAVPELRKSKDETSGDVVLTVNGIDEYAEVKVCGASGKGPFTVNQLRPVKFIPCIVLDGQASEWWVLSPMILVREAAKRDRGQHTENPFECMQMALSAFKKVAVGPLNGGGIRPAVESAVSQAKPHAQLRNEMQRVVRECAELAAKHRDQLRALIASEFGDCGNDVEAGEGMT